jgi:cytochrome c556
MKLFSRAALPVLLLATFLPLRADTEMDGSMKKISASSKQLAADLKQTDPTKHQKDADLQLVATMKAEAVKSRSLVPKKTETLPPDQQQPMVQDFQKDMDKFAADIDLVGQDITAEKWDVALTDFQKLLDDEHAGHKAYRIKK